MLCRWLIKLSGSVTLVHRGISTFRAFIVKGGSVGAVFAGIYNSVLVSTPQLLSCLITSGCHVICLAIQVPFVGYPGTY